MTIMILKMSAMTAIYVLLTWLLWKWQKNKELSPGRKILIGLIFGAASIASTHFGVDYSHMLLNVRDLGPLSAGMFFNPISGILAGLIGGIERYIAGTYWGIGSYTAVACSVSTCLAGFLAAFVHLFILKHKKPSPVYGFFMGAVMEVFHMYAVFFTHRDDMNMAFYVVKNCSVPMIVFTALGVAASAVVLQICSGEWSNPFRKRKKEEVSVSTKFQVRLFIVTVAIILTTFLFSFHVQTQSAEENAQNILMNAAIQIQTAYSRVDTMAENVDTLFIVSKDGKTSFVFPAQISWSRDSIESIGVESRGDTLVAKLLIRENTPDMPLDCPVWVYSTVKGSVDEHYAITPVGPVHTLIKK